MLFPLAFGVQKIITKDLCKKTSVQTASVQTATTKLGRLQKLVPDVGVVALGPSPSPSKISPCKVSRKTGGLR